MYGTVVAALLVTLVLALVRAFKGPTVFDRALAGNAVGTATMMLLAIFEFISERPAFVDLAIVYGLLNVIGTIALQKFFRYGDLGEPGRTEEDRA
ncbi:pH regulation protein F [Nitrogeniibacter mangrovi]|uniref:pH regulation protein F n=2 Tax=Nitrogeniibacter mangrovi TaxID=2016596 RepID=A0A6C1B936_9RHOO|nr:pH regulation protein F [Nitrogeniibacter mangrovi]